VEALPVLREQNTGAGGMYQRFEDAGHELHQIDIVGARDATDEEVEALQLEKPYAVSIVRVTRDKSTGQVLEVGDLLVVPGRQELLYEV
jgi:GntR family transcriptional regulator